MLSLLVLVLMFASIDCQSNPLICEFLSKEGRLKDLGLYQFVTQFIRDELVTEKSYRLFNRETSEEYKFLLINESLSLDPSPI